MNNTAKTVLISLVVGAVGFGGGMYYAQSSSTNRISGAGTPAGQNRFSGGVGGAAGAAFRNRGGAGGGSIGEILKSDPQSVTIKLPSGGSQIIFYSDSTKLSKSVDATKDDLQVGKTIQVNGTPNSDGSIAAQTIQLRAAFTVPGTPANGMMTPPASAVPGAPTATPATK